MTAMVSSSTTTDWHEREQAPLPSPSELLVLEERGGTHSGADAHRNDTEFLLRALEVVQQRRDLARAGAAEWVAKRDRPAERVDLTATYTRGRKRERDVRCRGGERASRRTAWRRCVPRRRVAC